jgi:ParB-like chromosome segregation protein Spo0J
MRQNLSPAVGIHPAAHAFPEMSSSELQDLADDIKTNGLAVAIMRSSDGTILDGRNRLAACEIAGVEPRFEKYAGDNPVAFIISANLRRRHLNESQRALVAAKIARLAHGGDRRSDQAAKLPHEIPTQAAAGALLNVSERLIRHAGVVNKHGTPELIRKVEAGEISVSAAAKQAQPPKPKPKPKPQPAKPVIYIARIKSAFVRVEKAAAGGNAKLFQKELRQLIAAAEEQIK